MTNENLKIKIAEFVRERGFCYSHNCRWNIDRASRFEVEDAIGEMLAEGYLARSEDASGRFCLVRPFGPVNLDPPLIDSQRTVLEACEREDKDEFQLGRRGVRESIEDCLGERVKWLRIVRSRGGNRLRITPRGRAALFRARRADQRREVAA